MPNIRILAQAVLKILCLQGFSIGILAESKKGHDDDDDDLMFNDASTHRVICV